MSTTRGEDYEGRIRQAFSGSPQPVLLEAMAKLHSAGPSDLVVASLEVAAAARDLLDQDSLEAVIRDIPDVYSPLRILPVGVERVASAFRTALGPASPQVRTARASSLLSEGTYQAVADLPDNVHTISSRAYRGFIGDGDTSGHDYRYYLEWSEAHEQISRERALQLVGRGGVVAERALTNPALTAEDLSELSAHLDPIEQAYLATNPNCPTDLADRIAMTLDGSVVDLLSTMNLSEDLLYRSITRELDLGLRDGVIVPLLVANPRAPAQAVMMVAAHPPLAEDLDTVILALSHPNHPVRLTEQAVSDALRGRGLAYGQSEQAAKMLMGAAGHPQLSADLRKQVYVAFNAPGVNDSGEVVGDHVNWTALRNLKLDDELLEVVEPIGPLNPEGPEDFPALDWLAANGKIRRVDVQALLKRGGALAAWAASSPHIEGAAITAPAEQMAVDTQKALAISDFSADLQHVDMTWSESFPGRDAFPRYLPPGMRAARSVRLREVQVTILDSERALDELPASTVFGVKFYRREGIKTDHVLVRMDHESGDLYVAAWNIERGNISAPASVWSERDLAYLRMDDPVRPVPAAIVEAVDYMTQLWSRSQQQTLHNPGNGLR